MIDIRNEIAARLKQDAPAGLSNLQVRIVSAVGLAVVVLALTWLGGLPFRILACVVSATMLYEWIRMPSNEQTTGNDVVCGAAMAVALITLVAGASAPVVAAVIAIAFATSLAMGLATRNGSWNAWGIIYAGVAALSVAQLRSDDTAGLVAILFLFAVVWATDIFAYFSGRSLGGAKLAPAISPNKTWSGAVAGAAAAVAAGILIATAIGGAGGWAIPLVALLLSIASQIGDLFESWVKRRHGVKDSGTLIPGHGGIMDRVDGLVAAAFALYLIGLLLAGQNDPAHGLFSG